MSDTVESGGWPRPPRWVRAIAGVATVAVLAGVVVARTGPHRSGQASAVSSPAESGNGGGRHLGGLRMLPRRPARMAGLPLPRGAGLRLVLGGGRPAWLWVPTGRTEPIRGLPHRGNGYQLFRIAGGWAALPFPGNGSSCSNCAPRPMPVYYIADGSPEARRMGAADLVAPAAAKGAVWLVSYRTGADMSASVGTAQQFSVSGAALGPHRRLPRGYVIDRGTTSGLLLLPEQPGAGVVRYRLWEPGTRRVSRTFQNVIAASTREIAWTPACTARCAVHVTQLPGGHDHLIPLPGRSQAYGGAFSPDSRLLALLVTARVGADGQAAANRLAVADVASARLTAIPGTTVGSGKGVDFGWLPGSDQLVADVGLQQAWQVALWRPGGTYLHVAVTQVPAGSWPVLDPGPY
jgi:hypothetical protein